MVHQDYDRNGGNDNCSTYIIPASLLFSIAVSTVESSNCADYDISLVEGASANEGKIKVCLNRFWGTVCYFDTTDAYVLCQQLGFQPLGIINC